MTTPQPTIAHRMAQIVAELLPPDADPQLAHALMPVFEALATALVETAQATLQEAIAQQDRRIERHEIWTMERLDERGASINELRKTQNEQQTQIGELQDDIEAMKAVGDTGDGQ